MAFQAAQIVPLNIVSQKQNAFQLALSLLDPNGNPINPSAYNTLSLLWGVSVNGQFEVIGSMSLLGGAYASGVYTKTITVALLTSSLIYNAPAGIYTALVIGTPASGDDSEAFAFGTWQQN